MAPIFKPLALAGALFAALSSAAPVNRNMNIDKREDVVVWETVTTVVWTTIDVTTTVFPTQPVAAPTTTISVTTVPAVPTPASAPVDEETESVPVPTPASAAEEPETTQPAPTVAPVVAPIVAAVVQPEPEQPTVEVPAPVSKPTASSSSTSQASEPTQQSSRSSDAGASSSGYSGACSKDSPCVGQVTFYDTATSASAPSSCGMTNDGFSENVLALPVGIMTDADCGKTVTVTYNGITKTGTVVDKCMGCDNTSVDLSRHFFGDLADFGLGRLHGVSWYIN